MEEKRMGERPGHSLLYLHDGEEEKIQDNSYFRRGKGGSWSEGKMLSDSI